jgi:hypothetical protein
MTSITSSSYSLNTFKMCTLNFQHVHSAPEFMTSKKNIFIYTCGESFQDVVVGVAYYSPVLDCNGRDSTRLFTDTYRDTDLALALHVICRLLKSSSPVGALLLLLLLP